MKSMVLGRGRVTSWWTIWQEGLAKLAEVIALGHLASAKSATFVYSRSRGRAGSEP